MITKRFLTFSILFLITLVVVSSCKREGEKRIPFSNPLDGCEHFDSDTTASLTIYDSINNLSFRIGTQWQIHFNSSLKITECMDTVASDKLAQVKTFTISTQKSNLSLYDFFTDELTLMKRDSVGIMEIGQTTVGKLQSLYVITKTKVGDYPLNNTFFYVQRKKDILVIQLGISEVKNPIEEICKLMPLIHSISIGDHFIAIGKKRILPVI